MRRFLFQPPGLTLSRWYSTTAAKDIVIGKQGLGVKDAVATRLFHVFNSPRVTDVVADHSFHLPAGELLSNMDIVASRAARKHCNIDRPIGNTSDGETLSNATVAADDIVFKTPVLYGDLVRMDATVVDVGDSSVVCRVDCFRLPPGGEDILVCQSLFTMVIIGHDLRPRKIVPAVRVPSSLVPKVTRQERKLMTDCQESLRREVLKSIDDGSFEARDYADPLREMRTTTMTIPETELVINRLFFPESLNFNKTIFGGEIMRWMEMGATHCARRFARCGTHNDTFVSLGMHSVKFKEPIFLTDWVTLTARVVYVKSTSVEVEVVVEAEREGRLRVTNTAAFVLLRKQRGERAFVDVGLDIDVSHQDSLVQYVVAKKRYDKLRHRVRWL